MGVRGHAWASNDPGLKLIERLAIDYRAVNSHALRATAGEPSAMIRIERERVFPTPVERGFSIITDVGNWPSYWPGLVRVEPESRWGTPGDQARLILRLLGREVEVAMTLREFVPNQLVAYDSVQAGLPSAHHERHFRPVDGGFAYRIVVEYEPRTGPRGLFDRTVVRRSIDRAVRETMLNLERVLGPA